MKIQSKSIVILLLLVLLTMQACSTDGTSSEASSSSQSSFTDETTIKIDQIEIKPEMNSNRLKIREIHLTSGELTLRLFSPDGEVQWEEYYTAPAKIKNTYDLELITGTWKLEFELVNATGNYDIQWNASD